MQRIAQEAQEYNGRGTVFITKSNKSVSGDLSGKRHHSGRGAAVKYNHSGRRESHKISNMTLAVIDAVNLIDLKAIYLQNSH